MSDNQPESLGDVITRVMDTLNTRRQEMCDFFDDFDDFFDGEFTDDGIDDGMTDSENPVLEDDAEHENEHDNDELSWDEACWSGVGLGWFYEEGKRKRQKRNCAVSNDPSNID